MKWKRACHWCCIEAPHLISMWVLCDNVTMCLVSSNRPVLFQKVCVHLSQKYMSIFSCSDELNHFPLCGEKIKKGKKNIKDGPNALCGCCTRWELNERRNVMAALGDSVCVRVCVWVTTTWDQLHIKNCPVASLTTRAWSGCEEICMAMRQREW